MPLTDLNELLEPWLDLPIGGKPYRVPAVDAATGLWCQRIAEIRDSIRAGEPVSEEDAASLRLDDDQEKSFVQRMLGDAYQPMLDDALPWVQVAFAARVAFIWTVEGRVAAEAMWERGDGGPEGRGPVERPAKKKTARKR